MYALDHRKGINLDSFSYSVSSDSPLLSLISLRAILTSVSLPIKNWLFKFRMLPYPISPPSHLSPIGSFTAITSRMLSALGEVRLKFQCALTLFVLTFLYLLLVHSDPLLLPIALPWKAAIQQTNTPYTGSPFACWYSQSRDLSPPYHISVSLPLLLLSAYYSTLKTEAACSSEITVTFYNTVPRHTTGNSSP
jgi:hypothetical protein